MSDRCVLATTIARVGFSVFQSGLIARYSLPLHIFSIYLFFLSFKAVLRAPHYFPYSHPRLYSAPGHHD